MTEHPAAAAAGVQPPLAEPVPAQHGSGFPPLLIAAAVFVLAVNLRVGISSVGPVLPQVLRDLGSSVVFGSLLTTAPVIMMGLASPFSGRLAARFGIEWTLVAALTTITLSTLVRLWAGSQWILLATAVAVGSGIAAGNTMLPAVVRSYFPARTALMTGLYTIGINAGAGAGALVTPRVAVGADATWRGALAMWAVPAVVASALWMVIAGRVGRRPRTSAGSMPSGSRHAWLIAVFFGLQSMVYYGMLAWLAPMYEELGWPKDQAGMLVSFVTALQIVGAFSASLVVQRTARLATTARVALLVGAVGLLLVALTPLSAPWLWAAFLGLGIGGIFPLSLMVPLAVTVTVDETRRLTTLMLCYGYLLAATGPFVVSVLRALSGSFALGFSFLAVLSLVAITLARLVTTPSGRSSSC